MKAASEAPDSRQTAASMTRLQPESEDHHPHGRVTRARGREVGPRITADGHTTTSTTTLIVLKSPSLRSIVYSSNEFDIIAGYTNKIRKHQPALVVHGPDV